MCNVKRPKIPGAGTWESLFEKYKCMPEASLLSMKSKVKGHHVCYTYLKDKTKDHKCRENWKWVKSGQNKMFCDQGQCINFTFSNAELLVIEICI